MIASIRSKFKLLSANVNETKRTAMIKTCVDTRNEAFFSRVMEFWLLSSTLILLAKAKILQVLTCAMISVQVKGGGYKTPSVFYKKRSATPQSWNDF